MNKLAYNLITFLNELQTYESFMKAKGQMGEANVATSNKNFHRGSTSGLKSRAYSSDSKKWKKNKGGKGNKVVPPTTAKRARKSRLQREPHCKYLAKKKKMMRVRVRSLVKRILHICPWSLGEH